MSCVVTCNGKKKSVCRQRNISQEEQEPVNNLKGLEDIVFKQADKGSAVVAMDRDRHVGKAMRQLNDNEVCTSVNQGSGAESCKLVRAFLFRNIEEKYGNNFGLYRDDRLGITNSPPRQVELIRKTCAPSSASMALESQSKATKKSSTSSTSL